MVKKYLGMALPLLILFASCNPDQLPDSRTFPDFSNELFIINNLAETLSVLDTDTMTMYQDVVQTGSAPNDIAYHNGRLFIVNSGDNSISVLDESTLSTLGEIYLGSGKNPYSIITNPDSSNPAKAYVPNFVAGTVSVVDLDNLKLLDEIKVGTAPQNGCYANGRIYVCNTGFSSSNSFPDGSVSIIDVSTNQVTGTVSTGNQSNPQTAFFDSTNNLVHVICTGTPTGTNADDGKVLFISTATDTVFSLSTSSDGYLHTGGSPAVGRQGLDSDNHIVYLTNSSGGIMRYDYSSLALLNNSRNYFFSGASGTTFLSDVIVVPSGLFIFDFNYDRIGYIDNNSNIQYLNGSDGPIKGLFLAE